MPRTKDPQKYPVAFYSLMDKLREQDEVFIATPHPSSVRGQLQSFFLSLEEANHPRTEEAKSLMVRFAPKDDPRGLGILVCNRDRSPAAQAVLAALGESDSGAATAESSLLRRLSP